MPVDRLTALDASFLGAETPTAHMHVGWVARFAPPEAGTGLPSFPELRAHVARRLHRAPRYLQRIAPVPMGVHQPVWVDDEDFDIDEHLRHAIGPHLDAIADAVFSTPLPRDRPLWQMWVADRLEDGSLGLVGKVHHCMVDGLAAVELGAALLDPEPVRGPLGPGPHALRRRQEASQPADLFASSLLDRLEEQARAAQAALGALANPLGLPVAGARMARTLVRAALPPAPGSVLNGRSTPSRHLARVSRPLEDLKTVKARYGVTVNDVLLAAAAGGLRTFLRERGEVPVRMKAMVPVSVRVPDAGDSLGNRISFMFVELPCQEDDPLVRLMRVHLQTALRKRDGDPVEADAALGAMEYAPRAVQRAVTGLVASRRMFNLVVSNIPGPHLPMYLRGCRLEQAWPVVPLAEGHALSIGMTTVCGEACLGLYADRGQLPDADRLAEHVDAAVDDLLAVAAEPAVTAFA